MTYSEIDILFGEDLVVGSQLLIELNYNGALSTMLNERWATTRNGANKVTTGTPTINPGERTAINFVQAFTLDYNSLFIITRSVNVVTIKCKYPGYTFGDATCTLDDTPTLADVEFFETNSGVGLFVVTDRVFSTSGNPCTHIALAITTNYLATKILSPVVVNPNTDNPFVFDVMRGTQFTFTCEEATGQQLSELIIMPDYLNVANFSLQINNSPNGATVIVNNTASYGLDLEYSLDGATWQTDNFFDGLPVDAYTLHVRDNYGCSFTLDFDVDEFGINEPYFKISKSNSIRTANRIEFGDSANYKTDENTLSFEADVLLPYRETQQFQSADVITTQFKSNYDTNTATIIKEDLTEVDVPVVKKSNNIGLLDKRDAVKYDFGGGKTALYFTSGQTYDYNTGIANGTYLLNGGLPEWAIAGNYLQIGATWYLIENVIFDDAKNAQVVVFSNVYTGVEVAEIVSSIYNRFNYEVYEFVIDMVNYIDQYFNVRIDSQDATFGELVQLSEDIWCKVKHEDVLEIRYKNSTNTDMDYSTGIEHLIRIPFTGIKGKFDEESDTYKTDTTAILLNADLYEEDDFLFEPVTKEIWRKLVMALSHETVTLNGVGYVKSGNFNTEQLGVTNLYVLTATMIKVGSVYNSQSSGGADFAGALTAIPGLLSSDTGFVSY